MVMYSDGVVSWRGWWPTSTTLSHLATICLKTWVHYTQLSLLHA